MKLIIKTIGVLACVAAGVTAQEQKPINTLCPVMTDEEIDPEFTLEYEGRVIGFCCDRCVQRFGENPQRYLAALPMWNSTAPGAVVPPLPDSAKPESPKPGVDEPLAASEPDVETVPALVESVLSGEKKVPLLGRLHPALVHLPIAALPLALLAIVVWRATGREDFARADILPLFAAALGAVMANYTGDTAEEAMRFSAAQQETVERHENLAQIVMYLTLALSAMRLWRWKGLQGGFLWVYAIGLLAASGLVAGAGYLGGSLVFGPDHFAW